MGARYTAVVTRDGREFLIPNEDFVTQRVINWSYSNDEVRMDVEFGVSYDADPHKVCALAVEAAKSVTRVLISPAPVCHLKAFGDSSLDFILRFWIRDPIDGITNVRGKVLLALWDIFKREGIEIPFPQRDINLTRAVPRAGEREGGNGARLSATPPCGSPGIRPCAPAPSRCSRSSWRKIAAHSLRRGYRSPARR